MNISKIINIGENMKNDQNDFKLKKNIEVVDPKLKAMLIDMIEKNEKDHVKIEGKPENNQIDQKLKALMGEMNIDTKEIDALIRQSDRKKIIEQISSVDKTKPEKFKI